MSLDNLGPSSPSSLTSHISHGVENLPHHTIPSSHPYPPFISKAAFGLGGVSKTSDGSSACSSRSSPRLDSFDSRQNLSNGFSTGFDTMELDSDFHNLFPNVLDPYMEDPFKFSSCLPRVQPESDVSPWFEFNQSCSAYGSGGPYIYSQPQGANDQGFINGLTNLTPASFSKTSHSRQPFCPYSPVNLSVPTSASSGNPTTEELNQYCM